MAASTSPTDGCSLLKPLRFPKEIRLKIAVLVESGIDGGGEAYLRRLYGGLTKTFGVSVTLIGSLPGWSDQIGPRLAVRRGNKLTRQRSTSRQVISNALPLADMLTTTRRGSFDLVHVQYFREKLFFPALLRRRVPVLWTEHGVLPHFSAPQLTLLRLQSRFARVIAVSDAVDESLRSARIHSSVLPNPMPQPPAEHELAAARAEIEKQAMLAGARMGTRIFGYAGRLHPAKRVDLILRAARLHADNTFLILGDGPARRSLEERAPSNVRFLGHRPDAASLLGAMDCAILPSGKEAREGSPMAMLEARAAGAAVVMASDNSAASEALSLGCHTFDPDPNALAAVLSSAELARSDVPPSIALQRSESAWVRRHYEVMSDTISGHHASIAP